MISSAKCHSDPSTECNKPFGIEQIRLVCQDGSFIQSPQAKTRPKLWHIRHEDLPNNKNFKCPDDGFLVGYQYKRDNERITDLAFKCSSGVWLHENDTQAGLVLLPTRSCGDRHAISGLEGKFFSTGWAATGLSNLKFKCKKLNNKCNLFSQKLNKEVLELTKCACSSPIALKFP